MSLNKYIDEAKTPDNKYISLIKISLLILGRFVKYGTFRWIVHYGLSLIMDFISRCHIFCGIIITVAKGTWILERTQNDRFPLPPADYQRG